MDNITIIKDFMTKNSLRFLLVNATNEFLVEYNTLEENSRYKLTNFSGSTGEALVTPETIYLFVDGRYHIQADLEVNHDNITVVKLQTGQKYLPELIKKIPQDEVLGMFSKKNSQNKIEIISKSRKVKLLDSDPLDSEILRDNSSDVVLDEKYTGKSTAKKIGRISHHLSPDSAVYLTDLDEVSYLFNMRNFSQNYSAKIKAKALIFKDNAILFTQDKMQALDEFLKTVNKKVFVDKTSINGYDYKLLGNSAIPMKNNPVKLMKAKKTDAELEHLKNAFNRTDMAVSAIRDYIENNDNISEFDISQRLEEEFKKQGALGLSFKSIVAKDKNSALAHYSKCSKDEILEDGSLVLIDCGAYFEGGLATDITRVFVKGTPSPLQKKIYTTVLKAFLRAYNYTKTHTERPVMGFEIDKATHDFFNSQDLDGFVFNHGLGHGIGINVHEYPPNLSTGEIAKVNLEEGMCFSIEPGLYKEGFFGVRLENSCYYKDGQIHSFVHMNYENKLIDYGMMTEQEKEWLKEFEVK